MSSTLPPGRCCNKNHDDECLGHKNRDGMQQKNFLVVPSTHGCLQTMQKRDAWASRKGIMGKSFLLPRNSPTEGKRRRFIAL